MLLGFRFQAYADGINDYVENLPFLPLEFTFTGMSFEKWTIVDTLALIKQMGFFMNVGILG